MSFEELVNLPIQDISTDETLLYLWATDPKLPQAIELMKNWNFTYKGVVYVWVKQNRKTKTIFKGMGRYSRKNAEFVLLGARKNAVRKIPPQVHDSGQIILDSIAEHSKKPLIVADEIVRVCGDLPRIELFARDRKKGWDAWGNEVPLTDESYMQEQMSFLDVVSIEGAHYG